ncbi:hypothetical protein Tco_1185089 [Tanacetum coccineum]
MLTLTPEVGLSRGAEGDTSEGTTSEGTEAEPDNSYVRVPFAKPKRPTQICFNISAIRGTRCLNLHELEKGKTIVDTQPKREWSKGWRKKEWEWVHEKDPPYPLRFPKQILIELHQGEHISVENDDWGRDKGKGTPWKLLHGDSIIEIQKLLWEHATERILMEYIREERNFQVLHVRTGKEAFQMLVWRHQGIQRYKIDRPTSSRVTVLRCSIQKQHVIQRYEINRLAPSRVMVLRCSIQKWHVIQRYEIDPPAPFMVMVLR